VRAIVVAQSAYIPEDAPGEEVILVAGDPVYGYRFDGARIIGWNQFTTRQLEWYEDIFECRLEPGAIVVMEAVWC
jgi:hypothetical protein